MMKKPFGKWTVRTAAVITAMSAAAANGVTRPSAISKPPRNSAMPAAGAEQLLRAVRGETETHDQPKNQQSDLHEKPPHKLKWKQLLRKSILATLVYAQTISARTM